MVEIYGRVVKITSRSVTIFTFDYDSFLDLNEPDDSVYTARSSLDRFYSYASCGSLNLPYRPEISDDLVRSLKNNRRDIFTFTIIDGTVISAIKFKDRDRIISEYEEKISQYQSSLDSVRDPLDQKIRRIFQIVHEHGEISKENLLNELKNLGFDEAEARRLIEYLLKIGTLYEPRKGTIRKT